MSRIDFPKDWSAQAALVTALDLSSFCFSPTSHEQLSELLSCVPQPSVCETWPSPLAVLDERRGDPFQFVWPFSLNLIP
jgi:hypothetical protein